MTPEEKARKVIDQKLMQAGWTIQVKNLQSALESFQELQAQLLNK